MGSPYLLAHGLGRPVADAVTQVTLPRPGKYRVFVRTKDWVAPWQAPGQPGRFQVLVDGTPLAETFGTNGAEWSWQVGGTVEMDQHTDVQLALHDLTGFEGRCDAILFTHDRGLRAPERRRANWLPWRRELLGLADQPTEKSGYDLVVVGGGYAGIASAICPPPAWAAAWRCCRIGRCWGATARAKCVCGPTDSFAAASSRASARSSKSSPTAPRNRRDVPRSSATTLKEKVVRAEPNIDLFLNCHADQVEMATATSHRGGPGVRHAHGRTACASRADCSPTAPGTAPSVSWPAPIGR